MKSRTTRKSSPEVGREITIDFDRIISPRGLKQGLRQNTLARPNLDQMIIGARMDRHRNAMDHLSVPKKILTKSFSGCMTHAGIFNGSSRPATSGYS